MPCQHFAIFGESHRQHWIRLARGLNTSHRLLFKLFLCVTGQPKSIFTTSIKANCLVSHILGRFIGCHKMWRALLRDIFFSQNMQAASTSPQATYKTCNLSQLKMTNCFWDTAAGNPLTKHVYRYACLAFLMGVELFLHNSERYEGQLKRSTSLTFLFLLRPLFQLLPTSIRKKYTGSSHVREWIILGLWFRLKI